MNANRKKSQRSLGLPYLNLFFTLLLIAVPLSSTTLAKEKLKKDKFRGSVVYAGPKAISVRSKENIYLVRTFNYTPQLEQKIQNRKPASGSQVTVHYLRGTDLAVKVD